METVKIQQIRFIIICMVVLLSLTAKAYSQDSRIVRLGIKYDVVLEYAKKYNYKTDSRKDLNASTIKIEHSEFTEVIMFSNNLCIKHAFFTENYEEAGKFLLDMYNLVNNKICEIITCNIWAGAMFGRLYQVEFKIVNGVYQWVYSYL